MLQWTAVARFFFFFFFFKSVVTIGLGGSAGAAALNDSKQKFKSHDTIVIVNVSLLWTPAQVTSKSVLFCFIILYLQKFRHIQNTLWKQLDWRARHTLKVSFAKLYNLITKFVILHTLSLFFFFQRTYSVVCIASFHSLYSKHTSRAACFVCSPVI